MTFDRSPVRWWLARGATLGLICAAGAAEARPQYPSQVPTPYSCETCHLDPNDRLNRTGFGIDFALERGLWVNPAQANRGLCYLDSDYDGISNGEELNDPACVWRPGTRLPGGRTTHPGDSRDPDQCGDGVIIPFAEECDVEVPPEATCVTVGFDEGALGCTADCTFDASDCRDLPPPDMGPPAPDAGPIDADGGPEDGGLAAADAMASDPDSGIVDAMADDVGDEMGDAIADGGGPSTDAMGDAALDAMGSTADAGPSAVEPPSDCRAAPGSSPGAGWLLVGVIAGLGRRRRG